MTCLSKSWKVAEKNVPMLEQIDVRQIERSKEIKTNFQCTALLRSLHVYMTFLHLKLEHVISYRYEPPHGKTKNLHRRKQRRRSASR